MSDNDTSLTVSPASGLAQRAELSVELVSTQISTGDLIEGEVVFRGTAREHVAIFAELRTEFVGEVNPEPAIHLEEALCDRNLGPEVHRFPLHIEAPRGPYSYDGELFKLEWFLEVRAEVGFRTLKERIPIELTFRPTGLEPVASSTAVVSKAENDGPSEVFAGFTIFGVIMFGVSVVAWIEAGLAGIVVVNGLAAFACVLILYRPMMNSLANRQLGELEVELEPPMVAPSQQLVVIGRFVPPGSPTISAARCAVVCRETAANGQGRAKTTMVRTLHTQEQEIPSIVGTCEKGAPQEFAVLFYIPRNAAPSFGVHNNRIRWTVELTIELDRWPDWKLESEFTVRQDGRVLADERNPVA